MKLLNNYLHYQHQHDCCPTIYCLIEQTLNYLPTLTSPTSLSLCYTFVKFGNKLCSNFSYHYWVFLPMANEPKMTNKHHD